MTNLTILNSSIRTLDNLFSLNDLHLVSGNDPKHRPSLFIRNEQTKELIAEIEQENNRSTKTIFAVKTIRGGKNISIQGTWACEELALAYATWISPKFHLVVLRAFIAMHKGEVQTIQPKLPLIAPNDEEALKIIINLFHSLNDAYEMGSKLRQHAPTLANTLNSTLGGNYLYNLHHPAEQALANAKRFIQGKQERVMYVKGMLNLLEQAPC